MHTRDIVVYTITAVLFRTFTERDNARCSVRMRDQSFAIVCIRWTLRILHGITSCLYSVLPSHYWEKARLGNIKGVAEQMCFRNQQHNSKLVIIIKIKVHLHYTKAAN